jgi:hypothetical protein
MSCKEWKDHWVAHLYGELDAAEEPGVTEHLASCADCRDRLDELSACSRLLQESAPYVPVPPRVMIVQPRRSWQSWWAFAAGVACALLVFVVGLVVGGDESFSLATGSPEPQSALLTRADLEQALLDQQKHFEARLAGIDKRREPTVQEDSRAWLTRAQLEDELSLLEQRVGYDQERNFTILLREISAAQARTASWIDENREVMRYAIRNNPAVGEH